MAYKLSGVAKIANGAQHGKPKGFKHRAGSRKRKGAHKNAMHRERNGSGVQHTVGKKKRSYKRNPDFDFAGLPVVEGLAGAGIAIGVHALINATPYLKDYTTNATYGKYIAPVTIAAGGYALNHFAKNPMLKKIGTFTAFAGLFLAIDAAISSGVQEGVSKLFPAATVVPPKLGSDGKPLGGIWARGGRPLGVGGYRPGIDGGMFVTEAPKQIAGLYVSNGKQTSGSFGIMNAARSN